MTFEVTTQFHPIVLRAQQWQPFGQGPDFNPGPGPGGFPPPPPPYQPPHMPPGHHANHLPAAVGGAVPPPTPPQPGVQAALQRRPPAERVLEAIAEALANASMVDPVDESEDEEGAVIVASRALSELRDFDDISPNRSLGAFMPVPMSPPGQSQAGPSQQGGTWVFVSNSQSEGAALTGPSSPRQRDEPSPSAVQSPSRFRKASSAGKARQSD